MMLWTEYMMNEIAFLGLLRGKEVGIPPKCLKFNSPSFSVESKNRPAGQASHQALRLHRIFCFLWVFQSILGTDQGWKGQKLCRKTCTSSPAQGRQRIHTSISAAIPPFLFQRWHLSKIHADLIHTLQLTENPLHGVFCLGGYKNQRCNTEAEKTDVAHSLTPPGLWHLPCSSQRLGRARVLTLSAWLSVGDSGLGDFLGCRAHQLCRWPFRRGVHQGNPARCLYWLQTFQP